MDVDVNADADVDLDVDVDVDVNVKVNRRAPRNRRNEKQENQKQITVTAAPFWIINFQLQLQSCLRGELILDYTVGPSPGIKNVKIIARMAMSQSK